MEPSSPYKDVRRKAAAKLGPLSEDEWQFLVEDHWVDDAVDAGHDGLDSLVNQVRRLRDAFGGRRRGRHASVKDTVEKMAAASPDTTEVSTVRQNVVSMALWLVAQGDDEVIEFRKRALGGRLIPVGSSTAELLDRLGTDDTVKPGAGDWFTPEFEAQVGRLIGRVVIENGKLEIRMGRPEDTVGFVVEDADGKQKVVMDQDQEWLPGRNLRIDWLLALGGRLAREFPWFEDQANWFVVSNSCPLVREVATTVEIHESNPMATRLILRIDPGTSSSEVQRAFLRAREELSGGKPRALSEKHQLLEFATLQYGRRRSWNERLAQWNEMNPEWHYSDARNFRRDSIKAQKALIFPEYGELVGAGTADALNITLEQPSP